MASMAGLDALDRTTALPVLDRVSGRGCLERVARGSAELVVVEDCAFGKRAVAARDLGAREIVLIEAPVFLSTAAQYRDPAFLSRPEVADCMREMKRCAETYGHLEGAAAFPPDAQAALDGLAAHAVSDGLRMADAAAADAFWRLEDAHRRPAVRERVVVDGLTSEAGAKMNGLRGVVVGAAEAADRVRVRLFASAPGTRDKAVKRANLKSAGGVFRTNAFADAGDPTVNGGGKVLATLSRVNHACGAAANVTKTWIGGADGTRRARVSTTRQVKKGEELLLDYVGGGHDRAARRSLLKLKYSFDCDCATCRDGA